MSFLASYRQLSLKEKRRIWTFVFLGFFTLGAIVLECIAGLWHPAGWTIPWTEYLAKYVPWPVQLAAYVILATWLPFHFWRHDRAKGLARKAGWLAGYEEGHREGYKLGQDYLRALPEEESVPRGVCPGCHQDLM